MSSNGPKRRRSVRHQGGLSAAARRFERTHRDARRAAADGELLSARPPGWPRGPAGRIHRPATRTGVVAVARRPPSTLWRRPRTPWAAPWASSAGPLTTSPARTHSRDPRGEARASSRGADGRCSARHHRSRFLSRQPRLYAICSRPDAYRRASPPPLGGAVGCREHSLRAQRSSPAIVQATRCGDCAPRPSSSATPLQVSSSCGVPAARERRPPSRPNTAYPRPSARRDAS